MLGLGYVLGTKAGRRRYEQIVGTYRALTSSPAAKSVIEGGRRKIANRISPDAGCVTLTEIDEQTDVVAQPVKRQVNSATDASGGQIVAAGLLQQAAPIGLHGDQVAEQRVVLVALLDRRHPLQLGLDLRDLPAHPDLLQAGQHAGDVARQLLVVDPDGLDAELADQPGGRADGVFWRTASIHCAPLTPVAVPPAASMAARTAA